MAGLLSDVLPFVYSRADALKRRVGGLLSDPMGTFAQVVNDANDRAGGLLSQTRAAAGEGLSYGPATQSLAQSIASAYNPMGITAVGKSNIEDADIFADMVRSLGKEYVPRVEVANGGSVYVTVDKLPITKNGDIAKNRKPLQMDFKARFADHPQYWGSTISSDPITQNTPRDAFSMLQFYLNKDPSKVGDINFARFDPASRTGVVETRALNKNVLENSKRERWDILHSTPFSLIDR